MPVVTHKLTLARRLTIALIIFSARAWPGFWRNVATRQCAPAAAVRHRRSCSQYLAAVPSCSQCLAAVPSCCSLDRAACARQVLASSRGRQPAVSLPCATARAPYCDKANAEPRRCFLQPRRRAGQAQGTAGLSADLCAGADRPAELRQVGCVFAPCVVMTITGIVSARLTHPWAATNAVEAPRCRDRPPAQAVHHQLPRGRCARCKCFSWLARGVW